MTEIKYQHISVPKNNRLGLCHVSMNVCLLQNAYVKMSTPNLLHPRENIAQKGIYYKLELTQNERRSLCRFRSLPSHSAHVEIGLNEATGRETLQTSICCSESAMRHKSDFYSPIVNKTLCRSHLKSPRG